MKVEVSRKGVTDQNGKPVAVGTVLTIKGDALPGYLVNKATVVPDAAKRRAVTNPKMDDGPDGDIGGAGE